MRKLCLVFFMLSSLLLSSCHDIYLYRREYPELNSIAIESVIGSVSSEMNRVLVLDEDDYGRKLFAFMGYSALGINMKKPFIISIIVSQKTDDNYAFYYDTKNYMAVTVESEFNDISIEKVNTYFSDSVIESLKLNNDWNKPIDESQLFRVKVNRKKTCDVRAQDLRKYEALFNEKLNYNYIDCYSTDRNGLTLVSIVAFISEQPPYEYKIYLLILNDKHELVSNDAFIEVSTQIDFSAIYQFKLKHGWSFRY